MKNGLPFLLLNEEQFYALPQALRAARGSDAAIKNGLLKDEASGNSPYWLSDASQIWTDSVKVVSGAGVQDTALLPNWTGNGVRVFMPITKAAFDAIARAAVTGADRKYYFETAYPEWAIADLPFAAKNGRQTKAVIMRCIVSKVLFEECKYDYGRGPTGKPVFKGSLIQKRVNGPQFAAAYVRPELYALLSQCKEVGHAPQAKPAVILTESAFKSAKLTKKAAEQGIATPGAAPKATAKSEIQIKARPNHKYSAKKPPAVREKANAAPAAAAVPGYAVGKEELIRNIAQEEKDDLKRIDLNQMLRKCGGDIDLLRRRVDALLATKLAEAGSSKAAQAEVLELSEDLNKRMNGLQSLS